MCVIPLKKLRLLTKIYGDRKTTFWDLKNEILSGIADLNVSLTSISYDEDGFVDLSLEGDDEVVAYNYLKKFYGQSKSLEELEVNDLFKGYIISSGEVGFGIFVDIGIKTPYKIDVLVPLYTLREQLAKGKKVSVKQLISGFGLVDNFPLEISLEKISIGLKKIEGRISDAQLELFARWVDEGLDKLIVLGETEDSIIKALEQSRHDGDIIEIERIGWREYVLTCKFNTTAKGLIPEVGKKIPKAKLEIFSPSEVRKILRD